VTAKSAGATIILIMIAVGVVALFLGHRLVPGAAPTQAAHSAQPDAAMVGFRTLIDRDMIAINAPFEKSLGCRNRQVCTANLVETRSGAEALLLDLAAVRVPQVLVPAHAEMTIAAGTFIGQLDAALVQLQQPNSDYLAASGIPNSYNLRLAAAAVDCWPSKPLEGDRIYNIGEGSGIPCA
jgi:hypothetical protein